MAQKTSVRPSKSWKNKVFGMDTHEPTAWTSMIQGGPEDQVSEKVFVSQERVSGFPKKGADLRGSPGTSGEVWGTSGEVWETSGGFHSERTSGEVAENFRGSSGNFRGSPGTSQKLGGAWLPTIPVTRQICLQQLNTN